MRINTSILPALFVTASLAACATDDRTTDDPDTTVEVPVENIAVCFLPTNPPPSQHTFLLDPNDWPDIVQVHDYGASECATFNSWYTGNGSVEAKVTTQTTDPDVCVHTQVSVIYWYLQNQQWIRAAPVTIYGQWTANGCDLPKYHNYQPGSGRYSIRAARRTCAGQLCGWDYGFPFLQTGVGD